MKKIVVILMSVLLLISPVIAAPVDVCRYSGELIADEMDVHIYYECSSSLEPVEFYCTMGTVFVEFLKMCAEWIFPENPDGEYCVCKTVNGDYGCHSGNRVSFRPTCDCIGGRCY